MLKTYEETRLINKHLFSQNVKRALILTASATVGVLTSGSAKLKIVKAKKVLFLFNKIGKSREVALYGGAPPLLVHAMTSELCPGTVPT